MSLSLEERRNSLFTDDLYKDVAKEDLIFLDSSLENNDTQMAIGNGKPFGKDNPYHNKKKANREQRDELLSQIIHKKLLVSAKTF